MPVLMEDKTQRETTMSGADYEFCAKCSNWTGNVENFSDIAHLMLFACERSGRLTPEGASEAGTHPALG
ncbi:hypothetical protein LMG28140_03336 [Paraburkholderia metrosideri]|uniref:Uncharacterized protein n=1 Tax=Paraburkholderia metrosideri TaxID=580937 RepID=A0ABN7HVL7_9BURK|nr:hypothetical protein LMG28140_03336 [Paraburkholderia metrosideri]